MSARDNYFAGKNLRPTKDGPQLFEVFKDGDEWFWQDLPDGDAKGPYPNSDGAFLAALGD